jgi:D-glycero-D-manno-heptose 1,7-bisphosphate phosphatase
MSVRTVFIDRDGVINRKPLEGDYVKSWSEFVFLPGAVEALRILNRNGFRAVVVSNQRGIALGRLTEEGLAEIHRRVLATLEAESAPISAIYYCPHDVGACRCRKPQTGLFLRAQRDLLGLDFSDAFVVGDSAADMEAAKRLGAKKILIAPPNGDVLATLERKGIRADFVACSLLEATTRYILLDGRRGQSASQTAWPAIDPPDFLKGQYSLPSPE